MVRTYIPGSEWLYIKIYTGSTTADRILVNIIAGIVSVLVRKRQIKKWFFVRYMDTDFHLRIRLLLENTSLWGDVLKLFYVKLNRMVSCQLIWKIQLDTYNRELERYHVNLIEQTESLFYIDSTYTLEILRVLKKTPQKSNMHWIFSMKMIDALLDDFGYNLFEKQRILDKMDSSFKMEFGFNQFNVKQLNAMYRKYSMEIDFVVNESGDTKELFHLLSILKRRSRDISKVINDMKKVDKNNTFESLMESYIHMMMNRFFLSRNRTFELIVYNFLNRVYLSRIARLKYSIV
ncbi:MULTISPECIES: thiopeptide-type bacteriocin biosynthesis protein [unclassified Bacteroides]|uniref:thiopeptide-type bacteriocin biosynthesis protein n=1 Tax=unclassified Bacteroides TaxID=2646097 RepID=UPI0013EAD2E4|nr:MULTISPECIES: thiopeptide-type bacteriocin biosynthesis protein [unclassified Bacteroides]QTO26227.1 thiopeptide-type bacteriocin biosynthesis protein [Bacteroides sp. ZJ-18]